jgi:hypothetical protein
MGGSIAFSRRHGRWEKVAEGGRRAFLHRHASWNEALIRRFAPPSLIGFADGRRYWM